ncbi:MAG: glycosyltransferase family 4 protein [Candidatus Promineifilaceae bacterium]|jgi:glycosyltransferase involved in cell wall biosynthesis
MIYIDVSAAVHSRAGLGRYSAALARALVAEQPEDYALFYNRGVDGRFPETLPANIPQKHINLGYKPWRMAVLLAQKNHLSFKRLVPDANLFHSTEHLLFPLRETPAVLTVHDLIFKLYPDYHKRLNLWYLNQVMPLYCERAQAIIAVSEATKRDIVQNYGIDPAKIHVVYEAAADHFKPPSAQKIAAVRQKYDLPDRFLIHLSTIEPRKNLDRLLDALLAVRQVYPDLQLVLAGGKGWLFDDFFARIESQGLTDIVRPLGWVPDEDLPAVLAAADLAVQPSLYEGFGLPILEHMACGQVVTASNAASHPEVGGQAAAYFDPTEVAEMTAVILRLLKNDAEYAQRREMGLIQAGKFSWQRTARETRAVYDALLGM